MRLGCLFPKAAKMVADDDHPRLGCLFQKAAKMVADDDRPETDAEKWKIKKEITMSDVIRKHTIELNREEAKQHMVKYWNKSKINKATTADGLDVVVEDVDTKTKHLVTIRRLEASDTYYMEGFWKVEFLDRRLLFAGDVIGFYYDSDSEKLFFRVLKRGGSRN